MWNKIGKIYKINGSAFIMNLQLNLTEVKKDYQASLL